MSKTIAVISCGALKRPGIHPAGELYIGQYYSAARDYVKRKGWPHFILSSLYGLLHVDREVQSYDMRLMEFTKAEREEWGRKAARELYAAGLDPGDTVVFLCGKNYSDPIVPRLQALNITCETPLAGMGIGRQISYMRNDGQIRSYHSKHLKQEAS